MKTFLMHGLLLLGSFIFTILTGFIFVEYYLSVTGYEPRRLLWVWWDNINYPTTHTYERERDLIFKPLTAQGAYTDQFGMRKTSDSEIEDPMYQVVVLGDSITYGDYVKYNQSFPYYLSGLLNQRERNVHVYNAGVKNYGLDQELVFLEKYILHTFRVRPDVVVWNIYLNDVFDLTTRPLYIMSNHELSRIPGWIHGEYLQKAFMDTFPKALSRSKAANLILWKIQGINLARYITHGKNENGYLKEKVLLEMEYMSQLAEREGFKVLIVIAPNQGTLLGMSEQTNLYEWITGIMKESTYSTVDMEEYFQNHLLIKGETELGYNPSGTPHLQASQVDALFNGSPTEPDSVVPYGWKHLSPQGNFLYAEGVYDDIERMLKDRD